MLHEEALANARADKLLKEEEVWIRKGVEARRTRAVFRVQRLDQLRAERQARRERMGKVNLQLDAGDKSGKLVAELEHVSKCFGQRRIVRDFSARIQRGDKIGLIGPNGAGKTTLLRLILGELKPDAGIVRLGTKIDVAYFDQFRTQLDPDATLVDVISPGSDYVEIGGAKQARDRLPRGFPVRARARAFAGQFAVRRRAQPPAAGPPVRQAGQRAGARRADQRPRHRNAGTARGTAANYDGTLFLVSHDRTFLDNVVTQTIAAEGDGVLEGVCRRLQRLGGLQGERLAKERPARQKVETRPAVKAPEPAKAEGRQAVVEGAARTRGAAGQDRRTRGRTGRTEQAPRGCVDLPDAIRRRRRRRPSGWRPSTMN